MNIFFGTFLAVTLMPAILLGMVALLHSEQRAVRRVIVARTLPRKPCRPPPETN
jgi:hypothetical protein